LEKQQCGACGRQVRPIRANKLRLGQHSTVDGQIHVHGVVVDACPRCQADMATSSHDITIPLTHACPTGKPAEWREPTISTYGLRPDIGWELAVVAQCAHCNLTEHTVYAWVLERVPLPPDL